MCGIVGIAASRPILNRSWLETARDALSHRGPDDSREYWSEDGHVGLGHTRLSIIDLSTSGAQPMKSADDSCVIVLNGEIYNYRELRAQLESLGHRFQSTSDTESVLAAYLQWGPDCVNYLHGMFAFVIHDTANQSVFAARDRAGEKPFFYYENEGEFRFASELKALLADPSLPRVVNPDALDCYLGYRFVPGDLCILDGFHKLPPAHALTVDLKTGTRKTWQYWQIPDLSPDAEKRDETDLLDELEVRLEAAVKRQMVADVPVGLLLSGGVDSSLITAMAARCVERPRTFTVGFRDNDEYDESAHAQLIADHFGTDHTLLYADDVSPDLLIDLAAQYDEPIVDTSMIPTFLVTREIRKHCKVALGGDGGDELFGGYHSASAVASLSRQLSPIPQFVRSPLSALGRAVSGPFSRARYMSNLAGTDVKHSLPTYTLMFEPKWRDALIPQLAGVWQARAEEVRQSRIPDDPDIIHRMTRYDFRNYLPEDILVKVDRASMLNSLEVRAPFLDVSLIEFAYRDIPSRLKAGPGQQRKIMLKRLSERILPPAFDKTRKQGFGIPIGAWLRAGPWRRLAEDILYDPGSVFASEQVDELFKQFDAGRTLKEHVFSLVLFEQWRRHYNVELVS